MKRRSYRSEREFGLIVGGVFVLFSAWWMYRAKFTTSRDVVMVLGATLVLFGVLFPQALVYPNKAWMLLAEGLSYVSTRVILSFVFFIVLTPIGLIKRAMGWDPLHRRSSPLDTYWRPYSRRQLDPRHYEKMF
jgi:hypothetical protein